MVDKVRLGETISLAVPPEYACNRVNIGGKAGGRVFYSSDRQEPLGFLNLPADLPGINCYLHGSRD